MQLTAARSMPDLLAKQRESLVLPRVAMGSSLEPSNVTMATKTAVMAARVPAWSRLPATPKAHFRPKASVAQQAPCTASCPPSCRLTWSSLQCTHRCPARLCMPWSRSSLDPNRALHMRAQLAVLQKFGQSPCFAVDRSALPKTQSSAAPATRTRKNFFYARPFSKRQGRQQAKAV